MINAIQQLGLGVQDKKNALDWFANVLGFRTVIFNDKNQATFMSHYTGGQVCQRDAALVLNSHGGSGLEIWQHISRTPLPQPSNMSLQSIGFLVCKLRCQGIEQIVATLRANSEPSLELIGDITERPTGERCCYFTVFGTYFQLVEDKSKTFRESKQPFCAGVCGVMVGVTDMERSLNFYRSVLGYSHVVQDRKDEWQDWFGFHSLNKDNRGKFRRVMLKRAIPESGLYAELFGTGEIELIEVTDKPFSDTVKQGLGLDTERHLYSNRYWGDPGLIHLGFDVMNMPDLKDYCSNLGFALYGRY